MSSTHRRIAVLLLLALAGPGASRGEAPAPLPSLTLSGRVLDPAGHPAAGATVHLIAHRRFGPATATTGRDGRFSFPLTDGGIYRLSAEKGGYGGARRPEPLRVRAASLSPVELRLNRPAALTGRILGLPAREIRDADLILDGGHVGATGKVVVEPGGRYRISDLPPGEWNVRVQAGGRSAAAESTLAEGEQKVLDVVFPRLVPVRGRVLGPGGRPIADAQVVFPGPGYDQGNTYSGADGRFLSQAPQESHAAWARAPGFAPGSVPVEVAKGPVDGVEIRLQPGVTLTGRLLGLKQADCKPTLYAEGAGPLVLDGHADAPGHYAIPGLGPGDWTVVATCGEQSALRPVRIRSGEAAPALDLDFGLGPLTLSGRLLGEPGARYEVSLERTFAPAGALGRSEVPSGGSFRFAGLQPGIYQIYVLEPDLPADGLYRRPPRSGGEEIFGEGDSYESIYQQEIELPAKGEVTLDVRATPPTIR
jgi:sarcosine oxidase gamma subunit